MATEYEERFRAADLSHKLDRAEELFASLSEDQTKVLEETYPNQVPRDRAVILALRPRIEGADPLLIPEQVFIDTEESLTGLVNALEAYLVDSNIDHFGPLAGWTDQLVSRVPHWPAGPDLPTTDAKEIAARFRRSAGQQLRNLDTDFEKVKSDLGAFQEDLDNRTGQWGEQKTNLESELGDLRSTIENQQGRLDQAIESYQGQFSEAQDRRSEEHRLQLARLQEEDAAREVQSKEEFDELKADLEKTTKATEENSEKTLDELRAELAKAQDITGFIGATGTSAGYGKEAKAQKKTADWLRGLAIFFGLLAAGLAVWAVLHAEKEEDPSLTVVLSKAAVSLVFAGLAGYVATQSGHHRLREEQARRRELDLLALPAFIATLPEVEKEEITGRVATKLFLTQASSPNDKSEAALTKESIGLVGLLLDAIRKT